MGKFKVGDLVQRTEDGCKYLCWQSACDRVGIKLTDTVVVTAVCDSGNPRVADIHGNLLGADHAYWMKEYFIPVVEVTIVECGDEDGL